MYESYLKEKANDIRIDIIRMIHEAGSGHPGGSLGMTDIFTALYFRFLKINVKNPSAPNRDYLILSNGHICPALYATMAHRGFFDKKELMSLRKLNSRLQGHPHRESLSGLETSSGPLGSGLSQAAGLALGLKMDKKNNHIFCLGSDGEHDEGNTWEAVLFAHKNHLDNLTYIIDRNRIQIDGRTEDVMPLGSLKEKYLSFGWGVIEIDGNDMHQIIQALSKALHERNKPLVILANTMPGKGVSFMEGKYEWHGKAPNDEETKKALEELERNEQKS